MTEILLEASRLRDDVVGLERYVVPTLTGVPLHRSTLVAARTFFCREFRELVSRIAIRLL
jgi:hypothetical protein